MHVIITVVRVLCVCDGAALGHVGHIVLQDTMHWNNIVVWRIAGSYSAIFVCSPMH